MIGSHLRDLGSNQHIDPQFSEQLVRLFRNSFWQSWKHTIGCFNQSDPDVLLRVDLIETIRHHLTRGSVEFSRKFDTGRTSPDDCNL